MRIVVYGSRPGAAAVPGDVVYFVNGSIRDRWKFPESARTVHVVANKGLQKAFLNVEERLVLSYTIDGFRGARTDSTIVVGRGDFSLSRRYLAQLGYETKRYSFHDTAMRDHLVKAVTGVSLPAGFAHSHLLGAMYGARYYVGLVLSLAAMVSNDDNRNDWFMAFRPSNGVYALLHAIRTYGPDHEYVLCGVGLQAQEYAYVDNRGNRIVRKSVRPHLFADRTVLRRLPDLDIRCDDDLVCNVAGIKPWRTPTPSFPVAGIGRLDQAAIATAI